MLENKNVNTNVEPILSDAERQPCEIWTRVMGYHRSVSSFNKGKKSEFAERICFDDVSGADQCSTSNSCKCA